MELMEKYREEFSDIDDSERRKEMTEMNRRVLAFRCKDCRVRIMEEMIRNE
jgi:hypothetical protein